MTRRTTIALGGVALGISVLVGMLLAAVCAVVLLGPLEVPARASEPDDQLRLVGHPKDRFPLRIFAVPSSEPGWEKLLHVTMSEWNTVFAEAVGRTAFSRTDIEGDATSSSVSSL